jgi:predicted aconitase
MLNVKMELDAEELSILEGKQGETLRKALESVVLYGETFSAKRLVPLNGPVHLVTSFGIPILKPTFALMDELIHSALKAKLPFTVNPRPIDYANVHCNLLQKLVFAIMYGKQRFYEGQLAAVGIKDSQAFSCTCYLPEVGNTPKQGDILAWAESSAVVFANSVLGARTNRNSGVIELLCGVIGKTPEFGLLTAEGRKAKWMVEVKTKQLPNAQLLGSTIGIKVVEEVPYITGLDRLLGPGLNPQTRDYLKDMGAASASNGAVGLYHVEGITPEAVEQKRDLLHQGYHGYVIDDQEIERIRASYPVLWRNPNARPQLCFIGCPHLSLEQLYIWTERLSAATVESRRKKLAVRTILCAAPDVVSHFKQDQKAWRRLTGVGARLTSICPLMYMNNPLCAKQPVITNSNKLRTYTTAKFLPDEAVLNVIVNPEAGEVGAIA